MSDKIDMDGQRTARAKRRVPIGLKIFLGFAGILLLVPIGNILFISQLSKLDNIIQSTSSGMFRVALSQKLRSQLRQERSSRALFYHLGSPIDRRTAIRSLNRMVKTLEGEIEKASPKKGRKPTILAELASDVSEFSEIADSAMELVAKTSAIDANNLLSSAENRERNSRIERELTNARKHYKISVTKSDFVRVAETVDQYIKPSFYREKFERENAAFSAGAESLAVLYPHGNPLPTAISAISDTLLALFQDEIESGKPKDRIWDSLYAALNDTLENIMVAELSGISITLEKSKHAVFLAKQIGAWGTLILFILGLIVAVTIARKIAAPIGRLREATDMASRGEWKSHIEKSTNDEIGDLTDDFNAMLVELGKLDEMKSRFLASITHDLKSPIGRVRGNIANLQDGLLGPITEGQAELFDMMSNDIDKLSRLIHDILDLQKMKAGAFKLAIQTVDLEGFLMKSLEQHASEFLDRNIELGTKIEIEGLKADIDQRQIDRVLDNLITNALKFTSPGGRIIVEAKKAKDELVVKVYDNGVGIPKEYLDRIFGEFYQVENKVKTAKGSGLGLAISKKIVEAHGGRIWAESEPGIGTFFAFSIPLAKRGRQDGR